MERNNFTPESFMPYLSTGCKSAFLIAIVLCLSATQALAVTTYEGILTVVLFGSPPAQGGAVTNVPATYQVGAGNDLAQSVMLGAAGGSSYSTVTSQFGQAAVSSRVDYFANLVGPAGPPVPVHVIASGFADGNGSRSQSSAFFTLNGTALSDSVRATVSHNSANGRQQFMIDTIIMWRPNFDYRVQLLAMASTGQPGDNLLNFSEAFVDPQFIVDAAFAGLYSMTGVPGTAPVPEPMTAALWLLGLGAMVWARRRQF